MVTFLHIHCEVYRKSWVFNARFGTNNPRHVDAEMELSEVLVLYKGIWHMQLNCSNRNAS